MKFAYSSNAYRRWPIEEALSRIAAVGFPAFELMADKPHAWPLEIDSAQCAALRDQIKRSGLTISNVNAFMMNAIHSFWRPSWIEPDPDFRKLRIEHTKASLRLAAALGAKSISTEPGGPLPEGLSRDEALTRFADGLYETLKIAEEVGVFLLVEPEPGLLIETADQFESFAARFDSPMFGLNFDVGHFYCVADPLPQTIARLQEWTRHYHFEDIAANRVHEHLIPGDGAIDFAAVLRAIAATRYNGWITIELYPYLDDPDGAGRRSLEFLKMHQCRDC